MFDIWNRRYTGSKYKLSTWISDLIAANCDGSSFCDIFAGTGIISYTMLGKMKTIYINDFLYSNEVIYKAFFKQAQYDKKTLDEYCKRFQSLSIENLCENYISALVEAQARADVDLVIGSYWNDFVQDDKVIREEQIIVPLQTDSENCLPVLCRLYDKKLLYHGHYKLYRADIIRSNDLRFSDAVRLEDLLFNYSFYQNVRSVACISTPIYHYRNYVSGRETATTAFHDVPGIYRIACKVLEQGTALADSFAPDGDPDQIEQLNQAVRVHYLRYTFSLVLDVSRDPGSLFEKHRIIREIARDYAKRQDPRVASVLQRRMDRTFHCLLMHQLDLPLLGSCAG